MMRCMYDEDDVQMNTCVMINMCEDDVMMRCMYDVDVRMMLR